MKLQIKLILILVLAVTIRCDIEYAHDASSSAEETENYNIIENTKICLEDTELFCEIILKNIDANKDSVLDEQELKYALLVQIRNSHEVEILEEIKRLGLDMESDRISFEEYGRATFENYDVLKAGKLVDKEYAQIKNLYETEKKKWDFISGKHENSESTLDRMQFYSFVYSEEFPHIHEYESGLIFKQFDTNLDATLDFKEFINAIKIVDEKLVDFKNKKFKHLLDLNGDNFLDLHEFRLWYNPSIEQKIMDEIKLLLDNCDSDQNSVLDKTEIIKHCNVLVKSQLTDHGNMFTNISLRSRLSANQEL